MIRIAVNMPDKTDDFSASQLQKRVTFSLNRGTSLSRLSA